MLEQFVRRHDKKVQRTLEIISGLLTWGVILSPVWMGLIFPSLFLYFITAMTVYWSFLALRSSIGSAIGYRRYQTELQINWLEKCRELDFETLPDKATLPTSLEKVKHFILIPVVNEPYEVLKPSIDALFNQTFPSTQFTLVFTAEEKHATQVKATLDKIIDEQKNKVERFMFFVHPAGIEGEAIGVAGANRRWGAKSAVEQLTAEGAPIRDYIFTTIDCDHVLHEQYMARLTHLYLTCDKRDNRYYASAVYTFNNNIWRVPTMMRLEATLVTMGVLSDWGVTAKAITKDTFSIYSSSLITLIDADYWDAALGVDDTIFYWRALFARDGDFIGTEHYIPISADAVEGKDYIDSYKSLYKQLLRWGYGAIDFPLSVKEFLVNKRIPFGLKVAWTYNHIYTRVILRNIVFLITFGLGIATFVNPSISQTSFAYSLPKLMSVILTCTMVFFIPTMYMRSKLSVPMPKDWSVWRKYLIVLEGPLMMINLLTYSFIPFVDAQTRIMFGKKLKKMYHTQKIR